MQYKKSGGGVTDTIPRNEGRKFCTLILGIHIHAFCDIGSIYLTITYTSPFFHYHKDLVYCFLPCQNGILFPKLEQK